MTVPIHEVPTGVPVHMFGQGDGAGFRARLGIPADATVVGSVGRLAEEKNLGFLGRALAAFLAATPHAFAVIVGDGPSREPMAETFAGAGVADRVLFTGTLRPPALVDAYHAMDVFAFASLTETQGLVLAEAMAAGVAVVAIDAPGAREIVRDGVNGRLLPTADEAAFREALAWVVGRGGAAARSLRAAAKEAAGAFSLSAVTDRALVAYETVIATARPAPSDGKRPVRKRARPVVKEIADAIRAVRPPSGS